MSASDQYSVFPMEPEMPRLPQAHEVELSNEEKKRASETKAGYWVGGIAFLILGTLFPSGEIAIGGSILICVCVQMLVNSSSRDEAKRKKVEQVGRSLQSSHEQKVKRLQSQALTRTKRLRQLYEFAQAAPTVTSRLLSNASAWLRTADVEFSQNAYGPFWDAVESTIRDLAEFQAQVERLAKSADEYRSLLEDCSHNFPMFPLQSGGIADPSAVLDHLRVMIRKGQTNIDFATIWEHRQTRTVIIGGFRSLHEAILRIPDEIRVVLGELDTRLTTGMAEITNAEITTRTALEERLTEQTQVLKTISDRKR